MKANSSKIQKNLLNIEPAVIKWARLEAGYTVEDIAKKLNLKESSVISIEETGLISLPQLEKLAHEVYKRPLLFFFMKSPPSSTIKKDFRSVQENEIDSLSPKIRAVIRKVKNFQLSLKELYDNKNPFDPIHKKFKLSINSDPIDSANKLREYLNIEPLDLKKLNKDKVYDFYRNLLEKKGVFVFQYALDEAFRGFALYDKEFPIITISSYDFPSGKTFTLFHELAHILLNTNDLFKDDLNSNEVIEIFCNKFAAEFLVPIYVLLNHQIVVNHSSMEWEESVLESLANEFKVSKETILRRLLDSNKTTKQYYLYCRNKWKIAFKQHRDKLKESDGGPAPWRTWIAERGKGYTQSILNSYYSGTIDETKASEYLNIKINYFDKLQEALK
ncbi:MAG: XRE family transcriptional regulator [Candidatus Caenarcaniphilales bacterium]|nr:XRE family transcriptional regulator [Candidatus Caenarcaniphilales bacterium]